MSSQSKLISKMKGYVPSRVKQAESVVHHKLETAIWKNIMRVGFVAHIVFTKRLPMQYVMLSKTIWFRLVIAGLIIYLAYIDVISAALLGAAFVLLIQEYHSRLSVSPAAMNSSWSMPSISNMLHLSVGMGQKEIGPSDDLQIGLSSYGSPDDLTPASGSPTEFMKQIGGLGISSDSRLVKNPLIDDEEQPGTQYMKVNMGQHSSVDSYILNQPAAKTLGENIMLSDAGYITPKNLLDAQINSAQGADMEVPCAVESIQDSYNAQGLGMPVPVSKDTCLFSKVFS
jgi:hypothetical protein